MPPSKGKKKNSSKTVETLTHDESKRTYIPTAEYQSVMGREEQSPIRVAYERRNRDLDPQLVWRGKDGQDRSDLVVSAPPLFIQEKVHPKVLVDELLRISKENVDAEEANQVDLFADFNGVPQEARSTEFYQHAANWTNRMILGDSLQVMASLAEREGLRGQVQCIYIDPPYGIKFNSNFQWSTTSRDVKDGRTDHITREPEQVKAFRDTWRDGVHSYLAYLRDRLEVARDLLSSSGSVFVQIGDDNVHLVRSLLDEVFGAENMVSFITFKKTSGAGSPAGGTQVLASVSDYLVWYAKDKSRVKYRQLYRQKEIGGDGGGQYTLIRTDRGEKRTATTDELNDKTLVSHICSQNPLTSQSSGQPQFFSVEVSGATYDSGSSGWKTTQEGMRRLARADRLLPIGKNVRYLRMFQDFPVFSRNNFWDDTIVSGFGDPKTYVVQTVAKVIERCVLMTSDPGDLVLDPTCGSGTTAYVSEQWGRRWITIDSSRVALALARARVMGARYLYYILADSREGLVKVAEIARSAPSDANTYGDIRQGFVYQRVPHVMLRDIANNAEIDVIWEEHQDRLDSLRRQLNALVGREWKEWEIPHEPGYPWPDTAIESWKKACRLSSSRVTREKHLHALNGELGRDFVLDGIPAVPVDLWEDEAWIEIHAKWWEVWIARQREIDRSISANAEFEFLFDQPYAAKSMVRVAGPFTVESSSPHRALAVGPDDDLRGTVPATDDVKGKLGRDDGPEFARMVLDHLRRSGVHQAHKLDNISFSSLAGWPGSLICAEGRYSEGDTNGAKEKRAGIFVGPEFGTVSRPDLVAAAREARDAGFNVLISCAFNYDAHSTDFDKLGRIPILKARMNADLHMADDLKNTGKGNLFVVFGEPDIDILPVSDGDSPASEIRVRINGVDVFHPQTGEVRSDGPEGIACWFIDTDYNKESFFVRHAYFLGANDPYKSLKTTLKAEIDVEAWATLYSDTSRPFPKPESGQIAVKVINHLGDEVMKVFSVT